MTLELTLPTTLTLCLHLPLPDSFYPYSSPYSLLAELKKVRDLIWFLQGAAFGKLAQVLDDKACVNRGSLHSLLLLKGSHITKSKDIGKALKLKELVCLRERRSYAEFNPNKSKLRRNPNALVLVQKAAKVSLKEGRVGGLTCAPTHEVRLDLSSTLKG